MIGNDVIDLPLTRRESNWKRKGFIQKLFTDKEQSLIADNSESEIVVWLLWSMKEAAYKIQNRQTKIREYIPQELECSILYKTSTYANGIVRCRNIIYHTKTDLTTEYVHTVAVTSLNDLGNVIEIERDEIERDEIVKDENGIPYLLSNELKYQGAVSISNHGRFEKVVLIEINKD